MEFGVIKLFLMLLFVVFVVFCMKKIYLNLQVK